METWSVFNVKRKRLERDCGLPRFNNS